MNYSETKSYIERQLVKLGWEVRIDKSGYKKIVEFTHGNEERLGQLYYKLVGMGSQQPMREINDSTVHAAIADLKRMDAIVDKAKTEGRAGPKSRMEMDRISIDQLAKELETEVALDEKEARLAAEKFPKVDTAQSVGATAQAGAASTSSLPRILVVDDSPTIRTAVSKALKNDFSFVQAADGEAAWDLLKNDDSIELVVTDLMMPKLDGYELIKRIRADRTSSRIAEMPIIVVTTLEETNAKLRALVAGANDFVTKSTDAVELKMRVMARYQVAKSTKAFEKELAAIRGRGAAAARSSQPSSTPRTPVGNGVPARTPATSSAAAVQGANTATPRVSTSAAQGGIPVSQGGNAAARAPQPPPANAIPRNGAGAGAASRNDGFAATVGQSRDASRPAPEVRRPLSPAAASSPTSSLRDVFASRGLTPLVNVIDGWKRTHERLRKANPLTTATLGATTLIVLIVASIYFINRPYRHTTSAPATSTAPATTAPATNPEAETLATTQGTADLSTPSSSVVTEPAKSESAKSQAHSSAAKGDAQQTAAVKKADARKPVETHRQAVEVAKAPAPDASTRRSTDSGRTKVTKQAAETSVPDQADSAQIAAHMAGGDKSIQSPAATTGVGDANVAADGVAVATVATAPMPDAKPAPAAAPIPAAPPTNAITQADLNKLIKRFEFVYEAGDIEQFLGMFGDNVETNDTFTKADLRRDYEELFKTTEYRTMALPNVTWDMHDNKADGWGNFEVKVRKVGAKETNTYKGSLTFHVEKVNGRLYIKRLYHGQWRAG
jgi:CheY-like chemotaxis protein